MKPKKLEKMCFIDKLDVLGYVIQCGDLLIENSNGLIQTINHVKIKDQKIIVSVK
jgi:hypothetical protein